MRTYHSPLKSSITALGASVVKLWQFWKLWCTQYLFKNEHKKYLYESIFTALFFAPSLYSHTGETHGDNRQERKTETYWMRFWENIINISQLMQISGSYTGAESHYNMMEIFSLLCIAADSRLGWATLPCRSLWWSRRLHTRGGGEKWSENNSDILKKYMVRLTSLVFREECIMTACQHLASPTF